MTETERSRPTINDGLRLLRKIELCESDAAKLILLRDFCEAYASERVAGLLFALMPQINYVMQTFGCPCGARPESLDTHPHVGSCAFGMVAENAQRVVLSEEFLRKWYETMKAADPHHFEEHDADGEGFETYCEYTFEMFRNCAFIKSLALALGSGEEKKRG